MQQGESATPPAVAEAIPSDSPDSERPESERLTAAAAAMQTHLDEVQVRRAIELLYFAYRDFTADADALLARYQFGRAHHRVIYFIGRNPGMSVSELLALLRITKQSLAPILAQLIEGGFVIQRAHAGDRRRRRLYLSAEAERLEQALTDRQAQRVASAYAVAGSEAADGFCRVLRAMINPTDRSRFED